MFYSQEDNKPVLLVLVGPTAVGKTALAVKVAQRLNSEIISADSAQVYKRLNIGTAKPTPTEQNTARHHLIDIVEPDQNFSVADYQKLAYEKIEQLLQEEKIPFLVGGTGLYVNAVIHGYAFGPKGASKELRDTYERMADTEGLAQLYERLKSIDPEAASKIHPNDRKRIIRALEVYNLEGKPISRQVNETNKKSTPYHSLIFGLHMNRDKLYQRIEERVDTMLQQGWLEEVRNLYNRGYKENDPGMQVLGYRQLIEYIKGERNWENTLEEIKKQTRNLAKRQLTWFRREKSINWLTVSEKADLDSLTENICRKVKENITFRANSNF